MNQVKTHPQQAPNRPRPLGLPQTPAQVWEQLTPIQQDQVYQTLAKACRLLAHQMKDREKQHERE